MAELLTEVKTRRSVSAVSISLVERQQQQLRQKTARYLEEEITQLMAVANHNEQLFSACTVIYILRSD